MLQQLCSLVSSTPEIDQLFLELEQIFPYPKKAGVAVSGGSDSMLLSYLLVSFFAKNFPLMELGNHQKTRKNGSNRGKFEESKICSFSKKDGRKGARSPVFLT
ncbi:MAG: hypothetical protein HXJ92_00790 [candidate division SR1 bacterium]|nr:hypothetical protein [candidate division SR1 bacterium]